MLGLLPLRRRLAGLLAEGTGIGGGEHEQVGEGRDRPRIEAALLREQQAERAGGGLLIRKSLGIGIAIDAILAQLPESKPADEQVRYGAAVDARTEAVRNARIVAQDRHAVARQVHVGFNGGDAQVQGQLKAGQRVFRPQPAGSAMTLHVEAGTVAHGRRTEKNLADR